MAASPTCIICDGAADLNRSGACAFCALEMKRSSKRRYSESIPGKYRRLKATKNQVEITVDQFAALLSQPCAYCHFPCTSPSGYSLDRKDSAKGYSMENVVPCCRICNTMKSDIWTHAEFLEFGAVVRRKLEARNERN